MQHCTLKFCAAHVLKGKLHPKRSFQSLSSRPSCLGESRWRFADHKIFLRQNSFLRNTWSRRGQPEKQKPNKPQIGFIQLVWCDQSLHKPRDPKFIWKYVTDIPFNATIFIVAFKLKALARNLLVEAVNVVFSNQFQIQGHLDYAVWAVWGHFMVCFQSESPSTSAV